MLRNLLLMVRDCIMLPLRCRIDARLPRHIARLWKRVYRLLTVDHFISWAMYFDDPDGNGLEIYCDSRGMPDGRPLWHGENAPLEEETILAELDT